MDIKSVKDISNNIISVTLTVDAFGTTTLSPAEEKELTENFITKISYKNLSFKRNVTWNGTELEVTSDPADGTTVLEVTIPPLSNKELVINENLVANYKADCTKIPSSAIDGQVLKDSIQVAKAYCVVYEDVICDAIEEKMNDLRSKLDGFESVKIISV